MVEDEVAMLRLLGAEEGLDIEDMGEIWMNHGETSTIEQDFPFPIPSRYDISI